MFNRLHRLYHNKQKVAPMPLPAAIPVHEEEIAAVLAEVRLDLQQEAMSVPLVLPMATQEDQDYTLTRQILIMDV